MQTQYLASDDANPEFVGTKNPDASLSVKFYSKPMQNEFESQKQGRPIFSDCDFVKIFLPGDDKNIIDTFVREDHKERFPRQWQHYVNKRPGDQQLVDKTPLSEWSRITPSQAEELRALKFFAVEDVANASDAALQRIGMIGGMGAFKFRESAQRFLKIAAGDAQDAKLSVALAEQTEKNVAMEVQMQAMQAQLAALAKANEPEPEAAPRRGRPPNS